MISTLMRTFRVRCSRSATTRQRQLCRLTSVLGAPTHLVTPHQPTIVAFLHRWVCARSSYFVCSGKRQLFSDKYIGVINIIMLLI